MRTIQKTAKIQVGLLALACGLLLWPVLVPTAPAEDTNGTGIKPEDVLKGLRDFYQKTARPDGSFTPGIDPTYPGMSDCAYSDLAAVTYAVTIHKTFGWELPHEKKTIEFLLGRQKKSGEFVNVAGTVDPSSAEGKTYNTTQAMVVLHALGVKPKYNPLPVFQDILKKQDYKDMPPYMSSFFPLAYLCYGLPIPKKLDEAIRATMIQDETGYLNNHIAATFHASHYYRLVGEPTPKAEEMVARILRDQKANGSWLLHMPSRDRHATFDAVFTLVHEGQGREDCAKAIARTVQWVLTCRNPDGGFGHFPGSTSDADAIYFHVGTLVMGGYLKPADPLPKDPHLLSWGHLMPLTKTVSGPELFSFHSGHGWIGSVAFSPDGQKLAAGCAEKAVVIWDLKTGKQAALLQGHGDAVTAVDFSADGKTLATGSHDHTARIWDAVSGEVQHTLTGHGGAVLAVAFSPTENLLATASIDGTIKFWDPASGKLHRTLTGHQSWVNALAFSPDGKRLVSGSSDNTVRVWQVPSGTLQKTIPASKAEIRSVAWSPDGKKVAAGIRYGQIKVWDSTAWKEQLSFQGHPGDVWSVIFSRDSKHLISADGDWNRPGLVKIWNAANGKLAGKLQHTGEVLTVAVSSRDGQIAAGAADCMARVWDLAALSEKGKGD